MMSFALSELGLYNQAVLAIPLKMRQVPGLVLPDVREWRATNAVTTIVRQAAGRRIVLINEMHHDAQTRALTLRLLPHLRKLGFTYLAVEALGDDRGLMQRGHPLPDSGSEYLQEPIYGEIVRQAIRLGFVLVAYDKARGDVQSREDGQAENLFHRVFARDPSARLVVAAGYAHIDKGVGRLEKARPMAITLAKLTHSDPLSIDQTRFAQSGSDDGDDYHRLLVRFPVESPQILVDRKTGRPWSALPALYDLSVITPPTLRRDFADQDEMTDPSHARVRILANVVQSTSEDLMAFQEQSRPAWLSLGGTRRAFPIDTRLCRNQIPCVIDAHYIDEPDQVTPADRYAFMQSFVRTRLYLWPGRYRLRAWNGRGATLSETEIRVPGS